MSPRILLLRPSSEGGGLRQYCKICLAGSAGEDSGNPLRGSNPSFRREREREMERDCHCVCERERERERATICAGIPYRASAALSHLGAKSPVYGPPHVQGWCWYQVAEDAVSLETELMARVSAGQFACPRYRRFSNLKTLKRLLQATPCELC